MTPVIRRISRKDKHELYAQARVKLSQPRAASAIAGLDPTNAYRVENLPKVQRRIRELRERDELDISRERRVIREELFRIIFLCMPDLFTEDEHGNRSVRPISEWTDDERAAIAELWTDKDGIDRIRPYSKLIAIDLLMKLDGLVDPDTIALTVNQTVNKQVNNNNGPRDRIAGEIDKIAKKLELIDGGEAGAPSGS